jgi:T4-like virus tail tube protein gp19
MSALTTNLNFLQNVNFRLTFQHPKLSNLEYFCTSVNLPAASMGEVRENYRNQQSFLPGDTIAYEPLRIKFMISEDMANYTEALSWMQENSKSSGQPVRCDAILSILSSKNTANRQFQFHDAFPTALGELQFDTQAQTVQYLPCDLTLRFNYFKVIV